MIWFVAVVVLGLLWLAYNLTSDRRNPPMKRCPECEGEGVIYAQFVYGVSTFECLDCDEGWVEA